MSSTMTRWIVDRWVFPPLKPWLPAALPPPPDCLLRLGATSLEMEDWYFGPMKREVSKRILLNDGNAVSFFSVTLRLAPLIISASSEATDLKNHIHTRMSYLQKISPAELSWVQSTRNIRFWRTLMNEKIYLYILGRFERFWLKGEKN